MKAKLTRIQPETIEARIVTVRGQKVLIDADLAPIYGVATKALNQAVKRNAARFPEDFLFRLTRGEVEALNRSQIVTGSQKHRDPRLAPLAFTENGAIMGASVLNSPEAVRLSVRRRDGREGASFILSTHPRQSRHSRCGDGGSHI